MTTIRREIPSLLPADAVWSVIQDIGAVHTRLAPGFVVDTKLEDGPARVVTFANGVVARELIVGVDKDARRLAYSVVGGQATHHNASFQVVADGAARHEADLDHRRIARQRRRYFRGDDRSGRQGHAEGAEQSLTQQPATSTSGGFKAARYSRRTAPPGTRPHAAIGAVHRIDAASPHALRKL